MSDMISDEEINALLSRNKDGDSTDLELTDKQKDTLGEIGNISMGTSATTLFSLLNQKVLITTPSVKIMSWKDISNLYDRPCVGVKIDYTVGLKGTNILLLKDSDVKIISNLMSGGNGEIDLDEDLTEIDLSAIGEAMNQMVGSSSTSLASIIKEKIDIATPNAFKLDFDDDDFFDNLGFGEEGIVAIIFRMQVGNLIDSEIMQLIPKEFAIEMADKINNDLLNAEYDNINKSSYNEISSNEKNNINNNNTKNNIKSSLSTNVSNNKVNTDENQYKTNLQKYDKNINVQPVEFQSFDHESVKQQKENIDILMDVPLEVTVELGKTSRKIKEILEFSPGTIIELDKLAGEPIDILVNGKYVAKGEVVVIDENFAIRVTSITNADLRI